MAKSAFKMKSVQQSTFSWTMMPDKQEGASVLVQFSRLYEEVAYRVISYPLLFKQ